MSDAEAFAYIVGNYPPAKAWVWALHLIKRRPWRKAFHRPLANLYLRGIDHNGFAFAAEAFATFLRLETLSRILWKETRHRPDKRDFAVLALVGAVGRIYGGNADAALAHWRRLLAADRSNRVH